MPLVDAGSPPSSPRGYHKEVVAITASTTITENHRDRLLAVNSGSNVTLTLPNNLPYGFTFEAIQVGAGQVLFAAASGATLNGAGSFDRTRAQYSRAAIDVTSQSAVHGLAAVYTLSGDISDASGTTTATGTFTTVVATNVQATNIKANDGTASLVIDDTTGTVNTAKIVNITGGDTNITTSSASTDGGTSVEPVLVSTTMTGIGGVGGRMRAYLTTNVALGSWSNAFKGEVVYGAAGKTTGLGSSVLAEMTLSAGTADGTYAPVEMELNLGAGALTGTATSFLYMSVNGAAASTFDTSGYLFNLAGYTKASGKFVQDTTAGATIRPVQVIKVKTLDGDRYLPLYSTAAIGA